MKRGWRNSEGKKAYQTHTHTLTQTHGSSKTLPSTLIRISQKEAERKKNVQRQKERDRDIHREIERDT